MPMENPGLDAITYVAIRSRMETVLNVLSKTGLSELRQSVLDAYANANYHMAFQLVNEYLEPRTRDKGSIPLFAALRAAGDVLRILDTETIYALARASSETLPEAVQDGLALASKTIAVDQDFDAAKRIIDKLLARTDMPNAKKKHLQTALAIIGRRTA